MKKIEKLCFSGGGARAFATVGVLKKLKDLVKTGDIEMSIKEVSGVSAGSIIGLGYIIGYSGYELEEEIMEKNFEDLKDIRYTSIFSSYGIESGKKFITWVETMILKKGFNKDITFLELFKKTNIKFKVLATNLNKYKYTHFDYINTPDVKVTRAIRLSISVPFYFCAEKYENDIHVDGAVIDNYPIKLYKDDLTNVLGVKIINHGEMSEHQVENKINSIDSFIYNLLYCIVIQKEKHTTIDEDYKKHTIYIYTDDRKSLNFMLSKEEKQNLIDLGYSSCETFFKNNGGSNEVTVNSNVGSDVNTDVNFASEDTDTNTTDTNTYINTEIKTDIMTDTK